MNSKPVLRSQWILSSSEKLELMKIDLQISIGDLARLQTSINFKGSHNADSKENVFFETVGLHTFQADISLCMPLITLSYFITNPLP